MNNTKRLLGFCLLIIAALAPVYAETLPASSVASDSRVQLQSSAESDFDEGLQEFYKAKTKQECLVAVAKMGQKEDVDVWCEEFNGNLVFQITNQSPNIDPVDFQISIDGKRVIEKEMPYGAAHTMETIAVQVSSGRHVILVESANGQARKSLVITLNDRLYVAISYWYYIKEDLYGPVKRQFKINTSRHRFPVM